MITYQCSYCYELSQDEKYKGDSLKCPKCDKGHMRKYITARPKKQNPVKELPIVDSIRCCISCGRDTRSIVGICHLCQPNRKGYRADAETKGRKSIKINNARGGEGLPE